MSDAQLTSADLTDEVSASVAESELLVPFDELFNVMDDLSAENSEVLHKKAIDIITALSLLAETPNPLARFSEYPDKKGLTPLMYAILNNLEDIALHIIATGKSNPEEITL
jgi:hypothetical protein